MTLTERLHEATGLPAGVAAKAAGSLIAALRLSLDSASFEPIAKAVPEYNELMSGSAAALGARRARV